MRPGITDFSSIVFADEGEILEGHADPDLAYHQLIRPWKSRLGLAYIRHASIGLDLKLVVLTAAAIVSRPNALRRVAVILDQLGVDPAVVAAASRRQRLEPYPPPGAAGIVVNR